MRDISSLTQINVGCGSNQTAEYVNLDIRPECKPDVVADVRKLPFPDGRFSHLHASHVLEHLPYNDTVPTLREWIRVVKPGGTIRIIVPNLRLAAEWILKDERGALSLIYGGQDYPQNFHYTGFTDTFLRYYMREAGIRVTYVATGGYDLIMDGEKPCN